MKIAGIKSKTKWRSSVYEQRNIRFTMASSSRGTRRRIIPESEVLNMILNDESDDDLDNLIGESEISFVDSDEDDHDHVDAHDDRDDVSDDDGMAADQDIDGKNILSILTTVSWIILPNSCAITYTDTDPRYRIAPFLALYHVYFQCLGSRLHHGHHDLCDCRWRWLLLLMVICKPVFECRCCR